MSISHSLSNALSGLTASSRMAEIVSSNLANAMTEGYGRREAHLASQQVGGRGAGVVVDRVVRVADLGLIADRRRADAELSGQSGTASMLKRLEMLVGGIGADGALPSRIDAVSSALISASADPSSDLRLGTVVDSLDDLTSALNSASDGISALRLEADQDIAAQVDLLNASLQRVERLNADITRSRNSGTDPSALIDQRQLVIDTISEIVPLREMSRDGGQVALISKQGTVLIDGRAAEFGFVAAPTVTAEMTLAAGGLSGLTRNGDPIIGGATDGVGRMAGAALAAAFARRDDLLVDAQANLDGVARDLMERLSDPATDPSLAPGQAGLLTDAGAALDPAQTIGLAGRIAVNAVVDPDSGGALWRLRDGVGAAAAGPAGYGGQIGAWIDSLAMSRSLNPGEVARDASGQAAQLAAGIGRDRLAAEDRQAFAMARRDTLHAEELAGGVDSDHEMQMLLQIEQAYAANARVIQVAQSMIQKLMEISTMIPTSFGDGSRNFLSMQQTTQLRQRLQVLTREMSTGRAVDTTAKLGRDASRYAATDGLRKRSEAYARTASETGQLLATKQIALGEVDQLRGGLSGQLLLVTQSTPSGALATAGLDAKQAFDATVSALNTRLGGRAIFAGISTGGAALASADTMLADIAATLPPAPLAQDLRDAVDDWFDLPGGGFETSGYLGDTEAPTRRLGPETELSISGQADDEASRAVLKSMALATLAGSPDLALTDGERRSLLREAGEALLANAGPLTDMRARVGAAEAAAEQALSRQTARASALAIQGNDMIRADPYETAIALQEVQTSLETQYTLTARLQSLSLVRFLR